MYKTSISAAIIGATLTLASTAATTPAHAECLVVGAVYRVLPGQPTDPTGPSLYIKERPSDNFYYLLRLRDPSALADIADEDAHPIVVARGDTPTCPQEGLVRDLGTAVGDVAVLTAEADPHRVE